MNDVILKTITKIMIPFIQLYGAYVVIFGHISPGGGFAGGTILGSSFILYQLVFGKERAEKYCSMDGFKKSISISLIIYTLLKGFSFIVGSMGLEYLEIPVGVPGRILSGGLILPLNILVGMIVLSTMNILFRTLSAGESQ